MFLHKEKNIASFSKIAIAAYIALFIFSSFHFHSFSINDKVSFNNINKGTHHSFSANLCLAIPNCQSLGEFSLCEVFFSIPDNEKSIFEISSYISFNTQKFYHSNGLRAPPLS